MITRLLDWMLWNALLGGLLITAGAFWAARLPSPVRRLRILEWTLASALIAPLLATSQFPWQWSLKWLPVEQTATQFIPAVAATEAAVPRIRPSVPAPLALPTVQSLATSGVSTTPTATVDPTRNRRKLTPVSSILLELHLAAMVLITGWWLVGLIAVAGLWRQATPVGADVLRLLRQLPSGASTSVVEIRSSQRVPTACAFGVGRPRILLPQTLIDTGTPDQIRFALAHEWAHLSRGDLWTWRLTRLAQLTLWFQPAYWWTRQQVRLCQDFLADAHAVETGSAVDFAAFLVDCARGRLGWSLAATLPLSSRPSDLTRRITMLLKNEHPLERRCPRSLLIWALAAVVLTLSTAAFVRLEAQEPANSDPAASSATQQPTTEKPAPPAAAGAEAGETLTYQCRVLTKGTDAAVAGATIRVKRSLYGDPRFSRDHAIETTTHTTDAEGNYTVVIPTEQTRERYLYIQLDVEHPDHMAKQGFGYSMSMTRKNERLGERPFFETTKLNPAQPVTGRLLAPTGEPAANVQISGYQYSGEKPFDETEGYSGSFFKAKTDADGKFRLPIATPGRGAFWFQPNDAAPLGVVAPEARGDVGDLHLVAGFRVKGRVLDADGKPVAGVDVRASGDGGPASVAAAQFAGQSAASGGYERSAKTDENGEFELAPVEAGEYEFRVAEYEKTNGTAKFPGVFVHENIKLSDSQKPLEFRALPTVSITVRNVDAQGAPKRGFEFTVFGQLKDKNGWFAAQSTRPDSGVGVAEVPRGLSDVSLSLMENEHGSYRVRRTPGAELEIASDIKLGTVDTDVAGIEVVRYKAPVLLVKAVSSDGTVIQDFKPSARLKSSEKELNFEKQQDGRHRSRQMIPDVSWTVAVEKPGWKSESQEISLKEGEEREVVLILQPE